MKVDAFLKQKSFTTEDGSNRDYYILEIPLVDGSNLEVTLKSDKAKLLLMSLKLQQGK